MQKKENEKKEIKENKELSNKEIFEEVYKENLNLSKAEVTGSSPVISSNHKPLKNPVKSGTFKGFLFSKIFDNF